MHGRGGSSGPKRCMGRTEIMITSSDSLVEGSRTPNQLLDVRPNTIAISGREHSRKFLTSPTEWQYFFSPWGLASGYLLTENQPSATSHSSASREGRRATPRCSFWGRHCAGRLSGPRNSLYIGFRYWTNSER